MYIHVVSVLNHEQIRRKPMKIACGDGACFWLFKVFVRTVQ